MTITGEVLYKSKYNKRGAPIKIIDHNRHAWTSAVTIFPRERIIKYIPEDGFLVEEKLFDFIAQLSKNDPVSVWLLRSAETFDQFVKPNGELYRTEAFHNKMKKTQVSSETMMKNY